MTAATRSPLRFRFLRWLRVSLVVGAGYDASFALFMVFAPGIPTHLLTLPLPGATFYLWIMATFLGMLAALYLLAAADPRRYSGVVVVAIVGRLVGAAVFLAAAVGRPELAGLYPLAAADAAFGLAHALFWIPTR